MRKIVLILVTSNFLLVVLKAKRAPFPIYVPSNEDVEESLQFDVVLPNKDVLEVDLFVRLSRKDVSSAKNETMTTTKAPETTETPIPDPRTYNDDDEPNLVSVKDAIESFRQELIRKEFNISGIIESPNPFFRHFQLEHGKSAIRIRCTYISKYAERKLSIQCYEFKTVMEKRILNNGEMEIVTMDKEQIGSDLEFIDVTKYKQTLSMTIY